MPRLSPAQVATFVTAAEFGNLTQVARRLNLSPSAVSGQIRELEASIGFALFDRTTRKVTLTAGGREFLPAVIALMRQQARASAAADHIRDGGRRLVRVAAPLSVAAELLPGLVAAFRREAPDVRVHVLDTGVEWLSDRVAAEEADLALGPDRVPGPDVTAVPLFASPWVAWCTPEHPMARIDPLRWEDLPAWDFYAAGRDHDHSVLPRLPARLAERIAPVQVVDNISTALGLAAAGLGFTCSPAYVLGFARRAGLVMRPLTEPAIMRHMTLYSPRRRRPADHVRAFLCFAQAELARGGER